jgi:hypothetical protein
MLMSIAGTLSTTTIMETVTTIMVIGDWDEEDDSIIMAGRI